MASERRRTTRVGMPHVSPVQIQPTVGRLLNLSTSGALIENARLVWPGQICHIAFPVEGKEVQLLGRAVHASVGSSIPDPKGESYFQFRIGMEFVGVSRKTHELVSIFTDEFVQFQQRRAA